MKLIDLPPTSNLALSGPYRLTLQEFLSLPVDAETLHARELIYNLEAAINEAGAQGQEILNADSIQPVHRFTKGIYTRELTMPAGYVIVGKRHAQEHLVVMTEGRCTVFTERGQEELSAPCTFLSPAGEKRVLVVHEQTTWMTIHRSDATDLDELERHLILDERTAIALNKGTQQKALT